MNLKTKHEIIATIPAMTVMFGVTFFANWNILVKFGVVIIFWQAYWMYLGHFWRFWKP